MNKTIFPTVNSTVAFYNPSNFKITLCEVSTLEFFNLNKNVKDLEAAKKTSIINHEIRHYIDHIATLWGQRNILTYAKSIDTYIDLDYKNYKRLVDYSLENKRLFYNEYYNEVYSKSKFKKGDKPWLTKSIVAHKFDNSGNPDPKSPMIMFRFTENDGSSRDVARVPLSVVSLLETNATFEEIRYRVLSVAQQDEDVRVVEHIRLSNELIYDLIYNQNLAVYNVAVHLVANTLNIVDLAHAIETSAIFATITLNMPKKLVTAMLVDESNYPTWKKEIPFLIENFDYGFIFMNLIRNFKKKYDGKNINVAEILKSSELGSYESFVAIVKEEHLEIITDIKNQKNFKNLLKNEIIKGQKVFEYLGIGFEKGSILKACQKLKIVPHMEFNDTPLVLKDFNKKSLFENKPHATENFDEWVEYSSIIEDGINGFFEIRGI